MPVATTVERLAGWAADLSLDDVPTEVLDLCRAQRRSVLAAVAASASDGASRRVLAGARSWAAPGPVSIPGMDGPVRVDDAVYAALALSIALDFDDYVCFGHTGHSAVLVPVLLAGETGGPASEQLVAQVVANEIGARLGGACLIGPLNGQMWSFVHAAGASLAAGRLLGLDARRLAHALALGLYQAPRPTVPGFMAPDSKLLTAAEPALAGLRAARMAAAGVTGPLDALDHPQGFLGAFAYAPLPALLGELGRGWATRTLCIKPYPGCAYIDTTVDAVLDLGPPPPEDVESVVVEAGILTCEMNSLSARYGAGRGAGSRPPTPVTVNFSIPWSVAIALVGGRLSPAETDDGWLAARADELARLAARVELRHDWRLTIRSASAMAPLLPPRALAPGGTGRRALGALRQVRRDHGSMRLGPSDGIALLGALRAEGVAGARGARRAGRAGRLWSPEALDTFAMTFPARVRVVLRGGRELVAEADVPRGGAGHRATTPEVASREKLAAWGPRAWGESGTAAIAKAVDADSPDLWALLPA